MSEIDLEQAHSSEEPGTLASLREKHRQTRVVLSGHPNDPALAEKDEDELPEGRHPTPAPGETVEGKEPPATTAPEPSKKFKYTSQEEAERAADEAARRMHEATTKAAELERELEESKKTPPPPRQTPEEVKQEIVNIMGELDQLDPYANDYVEKRADLWAKMATLQGGGTVDKTTVADTVNTVLEQKRQEEEARRAQQDEESRSRNAALKMAKDAGLNTDDPITNRLFFDALNRAPFHEGVTLKDQVDYMIGEVREVFAAQAKARGNTSPEPSVLGRGSNQPLTSSSPGEESEQRQTLSSLKEKWKEKRKI